MSNTTTNSDTVVKPVTIFLTQAQVNRLWDALDEYGDARYHSDDEDEVTEAVASWTLMGALSAAAQRAGFADPKPVDPLNKQR